MKATLDVSVPTLEKDGRPANLGILREISALTNGKFGGPADLTQMVNSLSLLPEPPAQVAEADDVVALVMHGARHHEARNAHA